MTKKETTNNMATTLQRKGLFLLILTGLVTAFFSSVRIAKEYDAGDSYSSVPVKVIGQMPLSNIRVIDGDTVEADIEMPLSIVLRAQSIRFTGYDAWEASKRRRSVNVTDEEVAKGKRASKALESFLKSGIVVVDLCSLNQRDSYGRVLATAFVVWGGSEKLSVADHMSKNGHTRPSSSPAESAPTETQ